MQVHVLSLHVDIPHQTFHVDTYLQKIYLIQLPVIKNDSLTHLDLNVFVPHSNFVQSYTAYQKKLLHLEISSVNHESDYDFWYQVVCQIMLLALRLVL